MTEYAPLLKRPGGTPLWRPEYYEFWHPEASRQALPTDLPEWMAGWHAGVEFTISYGVGCPDWGSNLSVEDAAGRDLPMLVIDSAPDEVWRRFMSDELREHQTWIVVRDRAGMRAASRLARWLVRGFADGQCPFDRRVDLGGATMMILAGQHHRRLPRWKHLRRCLTAGRMMSMPRFGAAEPLAEMRMTGWGDAR